MLRFLDIRSGARSELIDITAQVQAIVSSSGIKCGICNIFVMHTTAGITVNEGADPSVRRDITAFLDGKVPHGGDYTHAEGNSDAHIKASLMGASTTIPVEGGKLLLGTWQAIYLCEFDGPRQRRVAIKTIAGN